MARGSGGNLAADLGLGVVLALGGWWLYSRYLKTSAKIGPATGNDIADPLASLRGLFNPQNLPTGVRLGYPAVYQNPADAARGVFMEIDPATIPIFARWRDPQ